MEPSPSWPALRLPQAVRQAALAALGSSRFQGELAWLSWAGTVWKLDANGRTVFVKRAADLDPECERLSWLAGRWPVPEMVGFFHAWGDDWLVTREVPVVPLYDALIEADPPLKATLLGRILRDLHSMPAAGCPFGRPKVGHVLTHGDFCLPNVLVQENRLSGLIDVGQAGLGSPEIDLAAGVWSLQYNFGRGFAGDFLAAYGWPPMTDNAIEKLRRKYGR
jgi:aminoglycoside phosphotransferase